MIAKPIQQYIDLWEAWIDLQSPLRSTGGTLYLIGDVFMNSQFIQPYFVKKSSPVNNPQMLELEIISGEISDEAYVTEIMYSEDLENVNKYDIIKIYANNELVKTIWEIEKLY